MALFADEYLTPALSFGNKLGLSLSASFLVVFDTFIHFGPQKWARKKIRGFVRKYGETRGLSLYLDWMKGYLTRRYAKEGRTPSQRANVVRYNRWRASVLQKLLVSNPSLNGVISLKAPQWRREVKVK
jgi:hypothetical protein